MPSLNARAHITDQLQARVAYSQAIVRPDISYTQNYTSLGFAFQTRAERRHVPDRRDRPTGTGGNPNLSPMPCTAV